MIWCCLLDFVPLLAVLCGGLVAVSWQSSSGRCTEVDHAQEVASKKAEGLGTNQLAALFGKSDTTIRKALDHARKTAIPGTQADEAEAG